MCLHLLHHISKMSLHSQHTTRSQAQGTGILSSASILLELTVHPPPPPSCHLHSGNVYPSLSVLHLLNLPEPHFHFPQIQKGRNAFLVCESEKNQPGLWSLLFPKFSPFQRPCAFSCNISDSLSGRKINTESNLCLVLDLFKNPDLHFHSPNVRAPSSGQ